jgi:DNA-binding GntR family transcriptional regulator
VTCPPDPVRFVENRLLRRLLDRLPEDVVAELREVEHALAEALKLLYSLGEVYYYTKDDAVLSTLYSLESRCWVCYNYRFALAVGVCAHSAHQGTAPDLEACRRLVREVRDCVASVLGELREALAYYTLAHY